MRFAVKSRHWEKWRLADDPVVRVLRVLLPHSELRSFSDRNPVSDVVWLPTPPEGSLAVVSIFVSAHSIKLSLPNDADTHGVVILGSVPTSTRAAWLVYAHNPIDADMAKLFDNERTKLKRIPGAASLPPGTRAVLWGSRGDQDRQVLELSCD
jgi:hypothetical protein